MSESVLLYARLKAWLEGTLVIYVQDVVNGQGVPSGAASLAYALSRIAASLGASLMWEVWRWQTAFDAQAAASSSDL